MKSIAFANQKGGVRKTTTTATIGYLLSQEFGKKVLLIDADAQKNLTKKFIPGYKEIPVSSTLYSTLDENKELQISKTRFENLDIVPSHISLTAIETEIITEFDARVRIKNALAAIETQYDYVLLDCPPNLGLLSINGLAASDRVIIPLSHLGDEIEGMSDLLDTITKVKKFVNPSLNIMGLLITMTDGTSLQTSFSDNLREKYGDLVFASQIPRSILMAEANDKKQIIFEYKAPTLRKQPIENSFRNLAQEIINRF